MIVPDTKENLSKCICMKCLTYVQCMKDKKEGLFYAKGKSACEVEEEECDCVD